MKILLSLFLVGSLQAFANTYKFAPQGSADIRTSNSYQLIQSIAVEVNDVRSFGMNDGVATITVNGKKNEYSLKTLSARRDGAETIKTFEAVLRKDLLADNVCDERESVQYFLTFTEINEYDHYSDIQDVSLRAEHKYTYDWCHSNGSVEVISYEAM